MKIVNENDLETQERVEMEFYYDGGIKFDDLTPYLRLHKTHFDNRSVEFVLNEFMPYDIEEQEFNEWTKQQVRDVIQRIKDEYPTIEPFTANEILAMDNAELRYAAITALGSEKLVRDLDALIVDRQTIIKKQPQTSYNGKGMKPSERLRLEDIETTMREYSDTYTLYKIDKSVIGSEMKEDVYIVGCNCTSTNKNYFLFIDGKNEDINKDAIKAIASTMIKDDGKALTKEEYLSIEAES